MCKGNFAALSSMPVKVSWSHEQMPHAWGWFAGLENLMMRAVWPACLLAVAIAPLASCAAVRSINPFLIC